MSQSKTSTNDDGDIRSARRHETTTTTSSTSQPMPSQFLAASPFVPSFLREPQAGTSGSTEQKLFSDAEQEHHSAAVHTVVDASSSGMSVSPSIPSVSSMTGDQYSVLVEWLPGEIQDLLQVNLSHLQATTGEMSSEDAQQSLRLRAAAATFDQLSMEQLNEVNTVWNALFGEGSDGAVVDGDPESVFAFVDNGLMPEEEEWFFSQMMQQNRSKGPKGNKRSNLAASSQKHSTPKKL